MQHGGCAANLLKLGRVTASALAFLFLVTSGGAASLSTFAPLFFRVADDLVLLQENFDNTPAQKHTLAVLSRARSAMLDDQLRDEETLALVVNWLGGDTNYTAPLDQAAFNARAAVQLRYDALGSRVANLPPSPRASRAKDFFHSLADDEAALVNAPHAAGIASLLAPLGRRLETGARLVVRAQFLPRPRVGLNAVRAVVNGQRFASTGDGPHSPNIFEVTAPGGLYYAVACRVVDGTKVINFTLPVVTDLVRYEVAQGFAALTYTPDVFSTNVVTKTATNGTFFVQRDARGREIFGVFSCAGPGLDVKDARFRIEIPRALRGE